jgi:[acyl-carrier-protein] S-malonyltransferase
MVEVVERRCPELLTLARSELGADPFEQIGEGTQFAQPALYCAAIAGWTAAGRPSAAYMAGHSLGEIAALVGAGSLSDADGLRLAVIRGRLMQEASEIDPGGMLAVLGQGEGAAALAHSLGLTVANDNAPGQIVLSGPREAIDAARKSLRADGLKTLKLPVAGAFHSPAMAIVVPRFRSALAEFDFRPPRVPVISSTTTEPFEDIRDGLTAALTRPVRWRETLLSLNRLGVTRFVETGPGDILTGLVRRTVEGAEAATLSSLEPASA